MIFRHHPIKRNWKKSSETEKEKSLDCTIVQIWRSSNHYLLYSCPIFCTTSIFLHYTAEPTKEQREMLFSDPHSEHTKLQLIACYFQIHTQNRKELEESTHVTLLEIRRTRRGWRFWCRTMLAGGPSRITQGCIGGQMLQLPVAIESGMHRRRSSSSVLLLPSAAQMPGRGSSVFLLPSPDMNQKIIRTND